ncbi:hypothetical protein KCP70_03005 [Salmonella enterica subsp. enterica]|nr:hypothetical protein KCP70_03005 [Salmonella enterica subsp. enterica]
MLKLIYRFPCEVARVSTRNRRKTCRRILAIPYVHCAALHMHVGDPECGVRKPFAKATKVLVDESRRARKRCSVLNLI